jgi:DNA uptake protein ComE-like DNA-binding protein
MSLRADHKALVFLGAVAVLGAGVRVSRASSRSIANPSAQAALDRQMASADSAANAGRPAAEARRSGGRARGGKRSSRNTQLPAPDSTSAAADSQQGRPSRKRADMPREGRGYINGRLDLDVATAAQIDSLPGVTPTIAKRIAADRMKRGPFLSLDGLRRVSGVGPALAKHLDSLVTFSGAFFQGNPQDSTIRARGRKSKRGGAMRPVALRTRAPPPMLSRL